MTKCLVRRPYGEPAPDRFRSLGAAAGKLARLLVCVMSAAAPVGAVANGLPDVGMLGPLAGLGLPMDLARAGSDFAAASLATLIRDGAAEAARTGLSPMSPALRARMAARYPNAVLAQVRWAVAPPDSAVRQLVFEIGDAAAVTLGRVILFDDARAAEDATLWAHELTHVLQYERWGIDGFARRYVQDMQGVEAEAIQAARTFGAAPAQTGGPVRERRPVQRPYRWGG